MIVGESLKFGANLVFKTKAGQIGITNLQLTDYQYLESIAFLQAVLNILFSNC